MVDTGTRPPPFQFRLIHLLVGTAVVAVVVGLVIQANRMIDGAREAARGHVCASNVRQLQLALSNYYDTWQQFPPSYVADESGKPMHSWRVLITPYLESSPFYYQYDMREPWDGPNNSKLYGPWKVFCCPSDPSAGFGMTSYVAVVGPGAVWGSAKPPSDGNAADGSADAILLVEISNSNIHWMEPRDLSLDNLNAWAELQHQPRLGSNHVRAGHVALPDGNVELLSHDDLLKRLRAMATQRSQ